MCVNVQQMRNFYQIFRSANGVGIVKKKSTKNHVFSILKRKSKDRRLKFWGHLVFDEGVRISLRAHFIRNPGYTIWHSDLLSN